MSEERWCRKVYLVALQEKTKWIQDIDKLAERYDLRGPGEVDQTWKGYIRDIVNKKYFEEWRSGVDEKSSLGAYKGLSKPVKSNIWDGSKRKENRSGQMEVMENVESVLLGRSKLLSIWLFAVQGTDGVEKGFLRDGRKRIAIFIFIV